jgi:hypothetical protein
MVLQYTQDVKAWLESERKKMKNFQNVVIGFGKGGKTLAATGRRPNMSEALNDLFGALK